MGYLRGSGGAWRGWRRDTAAAPPSIPCARVTPAELSSPLSSAWHEWEYHKNTIYPGSDVGLPVF